MNINPISNSGMYTVLNGIYSSNYSPILNPSNSTTSVSNTTNMNTATSWNEALGNITNASQNLYNAALDLQGGGGGTDQSSLTVSSSKPFVNPTLGTGAKTGNFLVQINQVAGKMEVASNSVNDPNAALNLSGSAQINGQILNVTNNMSLTDIKNEINSGNYKVSASIIDNKLYLTSGVSGASGAFTASDLTTEQNTTTSSNTSVAQVQSLNNQTNWTHDVSVQQIAGTVVTPYSMQDSFDQGLNVSQYNNIQGNWTSDSASGTVDSNGGMSILTTDASTIDAKKTVQADVNLNNVNGNAGVLIDYKDSNNYTAAFVNTSTKRLVLENVVNGVTSKKQVFYNSNATTTYTVQASTDGNGNYTANVLLNGKNVASVSANGWTNAVTKANSGVLTNSSGVVQVDNLSITGTTTTQQNAVYSVDGTSYTSSTNNVTIGNNDATILLKQAGSTTISNTRTNSVLNDLGILDSNGSFQQIVTRAQDASYSINGGPTITTNENNFSYNGVNISFGNRSLGSSTITVNGGTTETNLTYQGIVNFIGAYNSMNGVVKGYNQYVQSGLATGLTSFYERNRLNLNSIGITEDGSGNINIDQTKLTAALNQNQSEVNNLFLGINGMTKSAIQISSAVMQNPQNYMMSPLYPPSSFLDQYY